MHYAAKLTPHSGGGYVVTFRDIPEAITQGETEVEALEMAADALVTAMNFYVESGRPMPLPSLPECGEHLVPLRS